jgi:hypothetical protein
LTIESVYANISFMTSEADPSGNRPEAEVSADDMEKMLRIGLGLDGQSLSPHPLDKTLVDMAGSGLRKISEGLVDPDLTNKARAIRVAEGLVGSARRRSGADTSPEPLPGSLQEFEQTGFSPEELRMGLVKIAAALPDEMVGVLRDQFSINISGVKSPDTKESPFFELEETPAIAAMTLLGFNAIQRAEANHKLVKPKLIWGSRADLSDDQLEELVNNGLPIQDSPGKTKELWRSAYYKFHTALQEAMAANDKAQHGLRQNLANI